MAVKEKEVNEKNKGKSDSITKNGLHLTTPNFIEYPLSIKDRTHIIHVTN